MASRFKGISWIKARGKWATSIWKDGKTTHLGYFDDEEEAARAYDIAAARLGRPVNFPAVDSGARTAMKGVSSRFKGVTMAPSRFKGVSWIKARGKWAAIIWKDGKRTHLGCFDDEEEAARAYDVAAARLGRPVNFPAADSGAHAAAKGSLGKWKVTIQKDSKQNYLGCFDDEEDAAHAYDVAAARLGRPMIFPAADSGANAAVKDSLGGSSNLKGVSWIEARGKWKASIKKDGKRTHLGYFDDEEEAARAYDVAAARSGRPANFPAADSGARTAAKGSLGGSSNFKGVSWIKVEGKWKVTIQKDGKQNYLAASTTRKMRRVPLTWLPRAWGGP